MPLILSGNNLAKPITDATATPGDVVNGKIFYNNDGKQSGALVCKSINTITYNVVSATTGRRYTKSNNIVYTPDYNFGVSHVSGSGIWAIDYYGSVTLSFGTIVGFIVDGTHYDCAIRYSLNDNLEQVVQIYQYNEYFTVVCNTISFCKLVSGKSITFEYF